MMDDTDVGVKNKVPQFDRTIKPLQKPQPSEIKAARQRNFSPVYGSVVRWFYMFNFFKCSSIPVLVVKYHLLINYAVSWTIKELWFDSWQ
jgi:hypothetical protein